MTSPGGAQPLDLSITAIRPDDPAIAPLLADLQGNILRPNGRDFVAYVIIELPTSAAAAGPLLATLAGRFVTSAAAQADAARAYRATRADGGPCGTLALAIGAYTKLGIPRPRIPRDRGARFEAGMAGSGGVLKDPPPGRWEAWARPARFDALLGLFDGDPGRVAAAAAVAAGLVAAAGGSTSVQSGFNMKRDGRPVEPFGFADAISQPLFFAHDIPPIPPGAYDPAAPLDLVLVHDPGGAGPQSCGSFLVFRKLAQDVEGFRDDVAALAARLDLDADLVGAFAVGRFRDGTPVVDSATPTGQSPPDNSFQFAVDPDGRRCPFQSHARKTNPRGDTTRSNGIPPAEERAHRIVRRSMVFEDREGAALRQTGLHFLCYQGDIANQFEFIQAAWSDQIQFVRQQAGIDALIGQTDPPRPAPTPGGGQRWPDAWDARETTQYDFGRWITLRGGAYLFAPSISFLEGLAGPDAGAATT